MQMREKVGKSRNTVFFQWFEAPEGRKVRSLKRRVRSQLSRWEMKNCTPLWREAHLQVKMYKTPQLRTAFGSCDVRKCTPLWREAHFQVKMYKAQHVLSILEVRMLKKCTPLWREAHFQVKMYKTHQVRTTFGSWDVEKVHTVVARSTFPSQNVQNTTCSRHFWRFGCWKSARCCGAKHISKSKCTKHHMFAPLLEVRMLKKCTPLRREAHFEVKMYKTPQLRTTFGSCDVRKCTPLWREAHFQVKMYKAPRVRATFGGSDVEKVHAVVARSTFPSQNVQNTTCSRHFWRFGCRFASLHYITLHYTPLH